LVDIAIDEALEAPFLFLVYLGHRTVTSSHDIWGTARFSVEINSLKVKKKMKKSIWAHSGKGSAG
jgi:hypothetical protein